VYLRLLAEDIRRGGSDWACCPGSCGFIRVRQPLERIVPRCPGPDTKGPLLCNGDLHRLHARASFRRGVRLILAAAACRRGSLWFSTAMVAAGTTFFGFLDHGAITLMQCNMPNVVENGASFRTIGSRSSSTRWGVRYFRTCLASSYLPVCLLVAATGAWYCCGRNTPQSRIIMLRWARGLAAVLWPSHLFFGHLNGWLFNTYQPSKMLRSRDAGTTKTGCECCRVAGCRGPRNLFAIRPPPFAA